MPVIKRDSIQVWEKQLSDGNIAVGIFNLNSRTKRFSLNLNALGIKDKVLLRDLWRQKDLGTFKDNFSTLIPSHGVVLLKVFER